MKGISLIFKFVKQMASHSKLCGFGCVKGHFRQKIQGSKALKQIEPWIQTFFTLKKHFFKRYNEYFLQPPCEDPWNQPCQL